MRLSGNSSSVIYYPLLLLVVLSAFLLETTESSARRSSRLRGRGSQGESRNSFLNASDSSGHVESPSLGLRGIPNYERTGKLFSLFNIVTFKKTQCTTVDNDGTTGLCMSITECNR